jgi:hypothetical protein
VLDEALVRMVAPPPGYVEAETRRPSREIARRRTLYTPARPRVPLFGRCAVMVDDGIATGGTARAALRALRRQAPARLVLTTPVASAEAAEAQRAKADERRCSWPPLPISRRWAPSTLISSRPGTTRSCSCCARPASVPARPDRDLRGSFHYYLQLRWTSDPALLGRCPSSSASSSATAVWRSAMSSRCATRSRATTAQSSPLRTCVRIVRTDRVPAASCAP